MATVTEFCLLGPVVVRGGGIERPVRAGRQRAVLAALLLDAGRVVSIDDLAETLWGPTPPPSARVTVQNYVMRLRRALGDIGATRIGTRPDGYVISVAPDELDVTRFEALLAAARAAARHGSWDVSAASARDALALWRGEPLADVDSELLVQRQVPRLAELRLQAIETRIDAELHLGRHAEVIAELSQLIGDHPLRERPRAQLMLALYRDGRQGEALAGYQAARQMLARELGTGPGAELRDLHQRMLTGDPALAGPPAPPVRRTPAVPRELPALATHFAGRAAELGALTGLLDRAGHTGSPATLVISAVGGTAGIGKTALAVHWAHRVAGRFPDGQLYVDLRGHDRPVPPAEALAAFLRSLGAPEIPPEEAERAARYRSLLTGRTMLIVLDNAGSAEQVRPLLPGAASCAALVTSRETLAGLVARDGAARLDLDLLPLPEAVGLLRDLIGGRADADPAAAAALAGQCARLPLALRVAAELAVARPAVPLRALVAELAAGPGGARAVFSLSCRRLDAATARAFRLIGLCPGPDLDAYATAALTGSRPDEARRILDRLAAAHLVQPAGPGRYGQHDLLRAYAGDLAAAEDSESERRDALTRLLDYYLSTAAAALRLGRYERAAGYTQRALDVARAAGCRHVEAQALNGSGEILLVTGRPADALRRHGAALHVAVAIGNTFEQARAHDGLGRGHAAAGQHDQARYHWQQALGLYTGLGVPEAEQVRARLTYAST